MYVNLGYVSMNFIPNETTEAFDGVRTPSGKSDASTTTSRRQYQCVFVMYMVWWADGPMLHNIHQLGPLDNTDDFT